MLTLTLTPCLTSPPYAVRLSPPLPLSNRLQKLGRTTLAGWVRLRCVSRHRGHYSTGNGCIQGKLSRGHGLVRFASGDRFGASKVGEGVWVDTLVVVSISLAFPFPPPCLNVFSICFHLLLHAFRYLFPEKV